MVRFVNDNLAELDDDDKAKAASRSSPPSPPKPRLPAQAEADKKAADDGTLEKGRTAMAEAFDTPPASIATSSTTGRPGLRAGPHRLGLERLAGAIHHRSDARGVLPRHQRPHARLRQKRPRPHHQPLLSAEEIELLAKWLRGEKLE